MSILTEISEQIKSCEKCGLCKTRTNAVPGSGNPNADIMFIGEGPGKNEDLKGEPFIGAAGKFLDELLNGIELKRSDVFITNIVKCRPPENRDPKPDEVASCYSYLERQVALIKPKLIVLLGRHAMYRFLPRDLQISKVHGEPIEHKGIATEKQIYLPMYHPAFALYNGSYRAILHKDFARIPKLLKINTI
ncbi:MAG: uracil-DNA glycosylase [Candidatus Peregrinibacteria bacterium]|nr:uracil-DNA glycosylase [Candidatus Peregrinibacteria bacterium]MDZ4245082.1 uracil-DNA glycosylase [Candidatus Gracilibacteria bacterium]